MTALSSETHGSRPWRTSGLSCVAALLVANALFSPARAQSTTNSQVSLEGEFNGDLRKLPVAGTATPAFKVMPRFKRLPRTNAGEPAQVQANIARAPMPSPIQNFSGLSNVDYAVPPDANGDVGPNHYIEGVNATYAVYNKSTGALLASFAEDAMWAGTSSICNGKSMGDPIVLYDRQADRWILTHVAFGFDSSGWPVPPFYQCVAASKTSDPVTGGWWLWSFRMDSLVYNTLADYPKFGIWSDRCLYMSANGFNMYTGYFSGAMFAVFPLDKLEAGTTLTWGLGILSSATDAFTMIPSNLLGTALPASGTPNYYVSESMDYYAFVVRRLTPNAGCGGGTLGSAVYVSQASYMPPSYDVVTQPGATGLDPLGDILMQKVQYRKVGSAESLWVVHSVQASSSSPVTPQWAELDVTGGSIALQPKQQQIYAPDTSLHRWVPSLAVDKMGNMAMGYSTSSSSSYPSIAYSGRLVSDPLNNLPQTETKLFTGSGAQTGHCGDSTIACDRWGDYTSMSVDPVDDCTFWYTNQYYGSTSAGSSLNWSTRIGSFKFASCGSSPPTITGPPSLPNWTAGQSYPSTTMTASNGTAPYTWSATGLPTGLGINSSTGVISGTPTAVGTFTPVVTVKDATGQTATKTYNPVTIANIVTIQTGCVATATVGSAYTATFTTTGGTLPFAWTVTGLPPGVTANPSSGATDTISGTPTTAGTYNAQVKVVDAAGSTDIITCSITVGTVPNPPVITGPASLPSGTVNQAYTATTVVATGGTAPYTWSATGFPAGMSINSSTGVISGTPTVCNTSPYTVVVTVKDTTGATASKTYQLTIGCGGGGCTGAGVCLAFGDVSGSGSVTMPVNITPVAPAAPASCQLDFQYDTSKVTFTSATPGKALTDAGKSLSCNPISTGQRCLAFGLNTTAIGPGIFASLLFSLSSSFTSGQTQVTPSGCMCSDAQGNSVTTACTPGTIKPGSCCDVNGDGTANVQDVVAMVNKVLQGATCSCAAATCSVTDVMKVVNAVLTGACNY